MNPDLFLILLIIVGVIGRSPIISTAASLLLILKLTHLERYFPTVERRGLELGLLFLTIAVLVPFATGRVSTKELASMFTSLPGILAIVGGMLATYMNGKGLDLLKMDPQLIIGLVIGSIVGIVMLRGIPVGPLMAAGITAFLLKLFTWIWPK
ncbi:MAG: DUF441 domain-containing protein [Planifilum sp.]